MGYVTLALNTDWRWSAGEGAKWRVYQLTLLM